MSNLEQTIRTHEKKSVLFKQKKTQIIICVAVVIIIITCHIKTRIFSPLLPMSSLTRLIDYLEK